MEERFLSIREKHTTQVEELKCRLDTVKHQLLQKEEECASLSVHWAAAKKITADLERNHKLVIEEQQKDFSQSIDKLKGEIKILNEGHRARVANLEQEHKNELSSLKESLSKT